MTRDISSGASTRSLLLLGGLTALALNKDVRQAVTGTARQFKQSAQLNLQGALKPALKGAVEQLAAITHEANQRGVSTLHLLRDEGLPRVQQVLGSALENAGGYASQAQQKTGTLLNDVQDVGAKQSRKARKALKAARKQVARQLAQVQEGGSAAVATLEHEMQGWLGEATGTLEGKRHHSERRLHQARRQAEMELRAARRNWKPRRLEKAVARKVAPLHKQLGREIKLLEKQARLARRSDRRGRGSGSLGTLVVAGAGVVALARLPRARTTIVNAVETVSPQAAQGLKRAGGALRRVMGPLWVQPEPPRPYNTAANDGDATGTFKGQTNS